MPATASKAPGSAGPHAAGLSWRQTAGMLLLGLAALLPGGAVAQTEKTGPLPAAPTVRVAAVGGLVLSGVWPLLAQQAGQALGLQVETVAARPKEGVLPVFERGDAELLLIHASDEALSLQASGHAAPVRVWAWNEHVLVGPEADPAGVRSSGQMQETGPAQGQGQGQGQEALRRIAAARAPFIAFRDPGSYTVVQRLWRRAGIRPDARWAHIDTSPSPQSVLQQAAALGAYAVVGHIPVAFGKMPLPTGMAVLLKGDPQMRRPYVVLTPGPSHPAGPEARRHALRLADYLVSPAGQTALANADRAAGGPWLYAATSVAAATAAPAAPARLPAPAGTDAQFPAPQRSGTLAP